MSSEKESNEKQEALSQGIIFEEFKEVEKVKEIASSLNSIHEDEIAIERAVEKYQRTLVKDLNRDAHALFFKLQKVSKYDQKFDQIRMADAQQKHFTVLESWIQDSENELHGRELKSILANLKVIVDQYQEQPHLLDPHLEPILAQLLNIARDQSSPEKVTHLAYKLLYMITKTRGFKVIVRLMPHEVADLEPVLAALAKQDPNDFQTWETRYMLLIWLSIVCMIPFDMDRLDSNVKTLTGEAKKPIMERIIETGQKYLPVSDKSRDAAAYMLSRFMTRPDVQKLKLSEFMNWSITTINRIDVEDMTGMIVIHGVINTLALLFKHGKREDLISYAPLVLSNIKKSDNMLLKKMCVKLVQRVGLIFLKPRVAAWRYERGNRSLAENLSSGGAVSKEARTSPETDDSEEYDIPDEIEDILEMLLHGLKDKDTVVRWSAAKGIGRITGRLPQELADEVVGSIMELFSVSETDGAWHGGCLALAELGRRGLLVPHRLPDVVPVIVRALNYDEKKGNFSVGAHVRDAACYVCWAFARAYDPPELLPHVHEIANALLIVCVFDREVNVRRAASAAFQEHVGRQGQFPHGIDILTTCDYFAVGNRNSCFLELSVFIAQFSDYTTSLIDHLYRIKTSHWDSAIREITAEGLHNLTEKAPEYVASRVLPDLVKMSVDNDLATRHGAVMATAHITHALAKIAWTQKKEIQDVVDQATIENLRDITLKLEKERMFRGMGGELMRKAVCLLVEKLSISKLQFHSNPIISTWQNLIDDCLEHVEEDIQAAAVAAIPAFFTEYYSQQDGSVKEQIRESILEKYLHKLQDNVQTTRMGYALAIGAFPKFFVCGKLRVIFNSLIRASTLGDKDNKFTEARRDAIIALTRISTTVGVRMSGSTQEVVCAENMNELYDCLFMALKDYTLDSRGDVGAWVREAAMTGLYDITHMIIVDQPALFNADLSRMLFCSLIQQASEKIDRTRAHAGQIFGDLLYHDPEIPKIPHKDFLCRTFPKSFCSPNNSWAWTAASETFPKFVEMLSQPTYIYSSLLGLTVSVGGLTESLVKHSSSSLRNYLQRISKDKSKIDHFNETLLQVFKDHQKVDRVTLPMLKMVDQLLTDNICFEQYLENPEAEVLKTLQTLCKQEVTRCGEVQKLLASVDVFCGLLQFSGQVRKKTLTQLAIFLCHKFPILRKTTSTKLYEAVVAYDGLVDDENMDELYNLLSETQWDQPIATVRPIRNQICDLFGIPKPTVAKKA